MEIAMSVDLQWRSRSALGVGLFALLASATTLLCCTLPIVLGLQRVGRRWIFEGGVARDLNTTHNASLMLGGRLRF